MEQLRDDQYLHITAQMVRDLGLKGNELLIFAIIHGFTQKENQWFYGSISYLSLWLNCSKPTILKAISGLIEKGLIEKEDEIINGVRLCKYRMNFPAGGGKETLPGSKESLPGVVKKLYRGGKETLPNNIYNKKENNKDIYIPPEPSPFDEFSDEVKEALKDFENVRKAMKVPNTDETRKRLASSLKKLAADDETKIQIINQSIERGWRGFFPLKDETGKRATQKTGVDYGSIAEKARAKGTLWDD